MAGEIEIGDALACRERETGQTGVLHVEADQIWAEFIGFGKRPSVHVDGPIHLDTAKGWVVSLFDNIDSSPTMPSWRRGEVGTVYTQRIVSNLALAGETAWLADDLAQSASFRFASDCNFLWSKDRAREIAEISVETTPNRAIFATPVAGGTVSLRFAVQGDPTRDKWTPTELWFTLGFDSGAMPRECIDRVNYLTNLFALLSWRDLRNEGISIRRMDAEPNSYSHRMFMAERRDNSSKQEARVARPISISADDETERETLQAVLRVWLDRQAQWQEVTGLMWSALHRFRSISVEQALNACRWHEAIERTKEQVVRPTGMDAVVDAAITKAKERDLEEYVGWIVARLSGFNGESRRSLFLRLARELNERLGHSFFDERAVKMALDAYKARNRAGHGAIGPMSKQEIRCLWGNVLAMEALCAARIIADLPLSESGRKRLDMHPLFRAFKQLRDERPTPTMSAGGIE